MNYDEDIIDCFNVNETLYIVFRSSGIRTSQNLFFQYPITDSGIEHYSAQLKNGFIIVYSTFRPVFFDTTQNVMSLIPPDSSIYQVSSSTERDPLDTFESSKNQYYVREDQNGRSVIYRQNNPIYVAEGNGYRNIVYDPFYVYFLSQSSTTILRIQEALYDTYRIPMIIPFCLDTNSTGLSGYRWFNGEDIRINGSGTLYAITYSVLSVKNGMASLRF